MLTRYTDNCKEEDQSVKGKINGIEKIGGDRENDRDSELLEDKK